MNVEVIRTNGTREQHEITAKGPTARIRACRELIGAELTDSVNLRDGRIMIVDDHGYETQVVEEPGHITLQATRALLPLNATATRMYHAVCRAGTTHAIVGDVVVCYDEDFI